MLTHRKANNFSQIFIQREYRTAYKILQMTFVIIYLYIRNPGTTPEMKISTGMNTSKTSKTLEIVFVETINDHLAHLECQYNIDNHVDH